MIERSESIIELSKALVKFHSMVGRIKKDSDNPFYKSKYAPLDEIIHITKKPLSECGLIIIQMPTDEHCLTTMLVHESGEYILSSFYCKPTSSKVVLDRMDNDYIFKDITPQNVGSNITYMRRYAYQSILSLSIGDKDDDGNIASGIQDKKRLTKSNVNSETFSTWILSEKQKSLIPESFDAVEHCKQFYSFDDNLDELIYIICPK